MSGGHPALTPLRGPSPDRTLPTGRRLLEAAAEACSDDRWGPLCGRRQYLMELGPGAARESGARARRATPPRPLDR